jgi:hypothetical protein
MKGRIGSNWSVTCGREAFQINEQFVRRLFNAQLMLVMVTRVLRPFVSVKYLTEQLNIGSHFISDVLDVSRK